MPYRRRKRSRGGVNMVDRRSFMQGAMAFGAAGTLPAEGKTAPKGALKLKLGVLSDIHITPRNNVSRWEQALRAFDKWGADGVLVCGDLADYGTAPELKHVADTWFKVPIIVDGIKHFCLVRSNFIFIGRDIKSIYKRMIWLLVSINPPLQGHMLRCKPRAFTCTNSDWFRSKPIASY